MEFFEIVSIIFLVIVVVLLFMFIIGSITKNAHLKNVGKKIKVKQQNMALQYMWAVLSLFNSFNMYMQMTTAAERGELSRERAYLFFMITWIIFFIYSLLMIIFGRYAYVKRIIL